MRSILYIIIIAIAVWVYSDATKRAKSSTEAALWAIGTFLLPIVVLPVWLITRPKIGTINNEPIPEYHREVRTIDQELDNIERLRHEGAINEEQYQILKDDLLKKKHHK